MKDIQRTFYIAAIVALSFLLLIKYQDFTQAKQEAAAEAIEASSNNEFTSNEVTSTSTEPGVNTAPATNAVGSETLIEVHTDVMNLLINTKGGDIVELTLNKHQTKLDAVDDPYQLLYRNKKLQRTYVSSSGLLGANGIDGKTRPLY